MNVEYTGRSLKSLLSPQAGRRRVRKNPKILGSNFETHVILSTEKRRHIAESRLQCAPMAVAISGASESPTIGAWIAHCKP